MNRKYTKYNPGRAIQVASDGQRNLENLLRELTRSPELTPALSLCAEAVVTNQANEGLDQDARLARLESKVESLEAEHRDLEQQIDDLRAEMLRMMYRIE